MTKVLAVGPAMNYILPTPSSPVKSIHRLFLRTCFFVVACTRVAAQSSVEPALAPPFYLDILGVDLAENFANPDTGRQPQDLWDAAGVTVTAINPTIAAGERSVIVTLNTGTTLGQAFETIQAFDFGAGTRWSLLRLTPIMRHSSTPLTTVSRVFNFSTRADVQSGERVAIGGMIVPGEFPRLVVFRARGPSLADYGIEQVLADPQLELFRGQKAVLANDDYTSLRTFEFLLAANVGEAPPVASESMIVTYLDPGVYTAVLSGAEGSTGVALLEMFLLDRFVLE